jgi:2-oxoglutarate dehydrogenase E1 component
MARRDDNEALQLSSFLYGGNAAYLDDLYARYEEDPSAVDAGWRDFFQGLKDPSQRRDGRRF